MRIKEALDSYVAELQARIVVCNQKINNLSYDDVCCRANQRDISILQREQDTLRSVVKRLYQIIEEM